MKTEFYNIGNDDWGILMVYDYDYRDFDRIWYMLMSLGMPNDKAEKALMVLSRLDTGMTYSVFHETMSVIFISQASSPEEWFDSVLHELKHTVEHISEFYEVDPKSEPAAYLQGEIGRQMFPMIMRKVCKCKEEGL